MDNLSIGKLARSSGIGIETIRFYEREGLLDKPSRRETGYRQYSPEVVSRPRFIKHAKELGFSLMGISELLSLKLNPRSSCARVKKHAEKRMHDMKAVQRAKSLGIRSVLAVVIDGKLADCCSGPRREETTSRAAGVGAAI